MAGWQTMVDIIPGFSLPAYFMPAAEIQQRVANIHRLALLSRQLADKQRGIIMERITGIKKQGIAPLRQRNAFVHGIINTAILFTDKTQVKLTVTFLQKFARAVLRTAVHYDPFK